MAERLSVSLHKVQKEFLDDNPYISPSALLQDSVNKIMQVKQDMKEHNKEVQAERDDLYQRYSLALKFIQSKGLFDDWLSYRDNATATEESNKPIIDGDEN